MPTQKEKSAALRELHKPGDPFIVANAWDAGSARILEGEGFPALATTSSGFALTQGRKDYGVTRDAALAHCKELADAVDIPVSADLENGWADQPHEVAETIALAIETGLAGGSIEDFTGDPSNPIYDQNEAAERIVAAEYEARTSKSGFVLTARAEGFLHGQNDLDAIIDRLLQFDAAGADVLFAPGLTDIESVRKLCDATSKPVNVLIMGGLSKHTVSELGDAGAARLSIGGSLAFNAYGYLTEAKSMMETGRFDALAANAAGAKKISKYLKM